MAKKIVIVNKKGGVGKTTTALNLAAFYAEAGNRVLAVDLDSQADLTIALGVKEHELTVSIGDVFQGQDPLNMIIKLTDNYHLLPARADLASVVASPEIADHPKKNEMLKFYLKPLEAAYDYIIFDTSPNVEGVLTLNALAMAQYAVIPVRADTFSLAGLTQLIGLLNKVKTHWWLNPDLSVIGLLVTFYKQTNDARYNMAHLNSDLFPGWLFDSKIRDNVTLAESISRGMPITSFSKNSHGYFDYRDVAEELTGRIERGHVCSY